MNAAQITSALLEDGEDFGDPKTWALKALTTPFEPLPRLRQTQRIFRRSGDLATAREWQESHKLRDGSNFNILVSLIHYKDSGRRWYISLNCFYPRSSVRSSQSTSDFRVTKSVPEIRRILDRARAWKGKLAGLPMRQRKEILKGMMSP